MALILYNKNYQDFVSENGIVNSIYKKKRIILMKINLGQSENPISIFKFFNLGKLEYLTNFNNNIYASDEKDLGLIQWRLIKTNIKNHFKIRSTHNGLYLTSSNDGYISLKTEIKNDKKVDFQLWFIQKYTNLIQNRGTGLFLMIDLESNIISMELISDMEEFYKWQLKIEEDTDETTTTRRSVINEDDDNERVGIFTFEIQKNVNFLILY